MRYWFMTHQSEVNRKQKKKKMLRGNKMLIEGEMQIWEVFFNALITF